MPRDIYPSMRYHDARAAIEWLERAFGFQRHVVYDNPDGTVAHAELRYGDGLVMIGSSRGDDDHRRPGQGWAYVGAMTSRITAGTQRRPGPSSSASHRSRTMDRSTGPATLRATCGASAPTGRRWSDVLHRVMK